VEMSGEMSGEEEEEEELTISNELKNSISLFFIISIEF
jgi:hypothetical protein